MAMLFSDVFPLTVSRYHEVAGAGSFCFAGIACGLVHGSAMWFVEGWQGEVINPVGLLPYCNPHNLLIGKCSNAADLLAATEEALRSGAVSIVVSEITQPLTLTAGRRLQLAAEAGGTTGLMIVPDGMGSNAAQTRWQAAPLYDEQDSTLMRWTITKNKSGTLSAWNMRWNDETHRITVVSEVGQRSSLAARTL